MKNNTNPFYTLFVAFIAFITTPVIVFLGGYLAGLILKWIVGGPVVNALNFIFNTTRFGVDNIPVICGLLSIVGSAFKSTVSVS